VKILKVIQGLVLALLTVGLSVGALLTASAFKWASELPSADLSKLDSFEFTSTSQIFARDGTQIGEILPFVGLDRSTQNRIPVSLDEVSPALLQAIVAYEDDDFFRHFGIDLLAIARATYEEFLGDAGRGGSTITTQIVKNELLTDIRNERSLERKVKEWMLALQLERRLTKEEILQRYINIVFWGGNVYGVHAAARAYFDKDPIELTLAESLYLARLIPAPNALHDDFRGSRASMRNVLNRMVAQGTISQEAADRAWREEIQPRGWVIEYDGQGNVISAERTGEIPVIQTSISSELSPELTVAVRNWLIERYGSDRVYSNGGLRVFTTIDIQAQQSAIEASRTAEAPEGAQLAIVGIEPSTGAVLAMVGERVGQTPASASVDRFNRALRAERSPGSSFKPIVYATAIEQAGFSQATLLLDEPTSISIRGQPDWRPSNHDNQFSGIATVRHHLNVSRNIPAVKALEAATAEAVAARSRELGYTNVQSVPAISLGAVPTTPLQHTAAMASFANGGIKIEPYFIERVEDADGNVLYQHTPRETRVWSPQTAYIMLDMMHGNVVDPGAFSRRANIEGRYVAGKTGTTNDERDIWFVGMTPEIVASVWIGYDDNRPIPRRIDPALAREDGTVSSSRQPIYIWRDFVVGALRGVPAQTFPVPEGIVMRSMDLRSGSVGSGGINAAFRADMAIRSQPVLSEISIEIPIDTRTGRRATAITPREFIEYRRIRPDEISQYVN
jgi:membrane peptidoglycan carboxypeptidase